MNIRALVFVGLFVAAPPRGLPEEFVGALTKAGWLAALIPSDYGGSGLGLTEASVIMEEINRAGGNAGTCHGQMYNMGTLLRHGSTAQKQKYLPKIASGELRLQSMGITEPTAGTDTTSIKTTAVKKGEGMSIFIVDLRKAVGKSITVRPIANVVNHETNELFIEDLEIPVEERIGEEGKGFKYILDGLNAERTLIAAEGVQFPIAEAHIEVEAASARSARRASTRWRRSPPT